MRRAVLARLAPILLAPILAAASLVAGSSMAQTADVNTDPANAPPGRYSLDKAHTSVTMKVSHMGLSYDTLRFDGVDGAFTYDPAHPEATKIEVSIDPHSVDTGDPALDRQIASELFEASRYPQIHFVSTAVRPGAEGQGTVVGDLAFHGVVKPVTLDVIYNGATLSGGPARMGFSASATLRRSDFGITKYAPMIGDEVSVLIEAEFNK